MLQGTAGLVRIEVFDRSMTIAAQFFSSVLPILILLAAWEANSDRMADAIDLPEESRSVIEGAIEGGDATFGIVGTLFVLGVGDQPVPCADPRLRGHLVPATAPQQPALRVALAGRDPRAGPVARRRPDREPVARAAAAPRRCGHGSCRLCWTSWSRRFVPWALLAGAVRMRLLLPGALLFAALMMTVRPATQAWLPRALETSADRYGSIGVAFTYLTWLYIASWVFLATAVVGQVIANDPGRLGDASAAGRQFT